MDQVKKEIKLSASDEIWMKLRKKGLLYNSNVIVPCKCVLGICDNYPLVNLCNVCDIYKYKRR